MGGTAKVKRIAIVCGNREKFLDWVKQWMPTATVNHSNMTARTPLAEAIYVGTPETIKGYELNAVYFDESGAWDNDIRAMVR